MRQAPLGYTGPPDYNWVKQRHAGQWNFLFCDGHTAHRSTREMFDPKQDDVIRRWNNDNEAHREQVSLNYAGAKRL